MTDIAISADRLAKMYLLRHQGQGFSTLRDAMTAAASSLARRVTSPLSAPTPPARLEEFWALKDISFEIPMGGRVGVIGRNGAGKSTLLKILSRIVEPTSGRAVIKGRVSSLLEVGTGFHPELTGRENIFLNGAILGMRREETRKRFDEIVAFAEVEKFIDTPVKRYSSGMYVRLAFAVAAHLEPEILIVDEVLAVGDAQFQKKCLGKMEDIGSEGRTVLFVSHNMTTIKALCDSCILLDQGQIAFMGDSVRAIECYIAGVDAAAAVPVADRPRASKCSLRAKIVDVSAIGPAGVNPPVFAANDCFTLRLTVEADSAVTCSAQVVLCDEVQPLSFLDSGTLHNKLYTLPKGTSTIECTIGPLALYAGNYRVTCSLNVPFKEVIDEVEAAYLFEVRECDPYDTGYNIEKRHGFGLFHTPHSWS